MSRDARVRHRGTAYFANCTHLVEFSVSLEEVTRHLICEWCDVLIFLIRVSLKCTSALAGGDERVRFGKNVKRRNRVKHNVTGRKLLLRFLINKGTGPR